MTHHSFIYDVCEKQFFYIAEKTSCSTMSLSNSQGTDCSRTQILIITADENIIDQIERVQHNEESDRQVDISLLRQ